MSNKYKLEAKHITLCLATRTLLLSVWGMASQVVISSSLACFQIEAKSKFQRIYSYK